jgi:hypothetical protein
MEQPRRWNTRIDMKKITVTRCSTKIITGCIHECPWFGTEMEVMVCNHPSSPSSGYIIGHDDLIDGFPPKCPLTSETNAN